MRPETRYARTTDGTHVAYQINGDGPIDIVVLRAWHSNLDHDWEDPVLTGVHRRLGAVGRVIRLDRRGTGLSDRIDPSDLPTVEARVDDMRAVLDAAGSERVVLIGLAQGVGLCGVFAATYPERTAGLVIYSPPPTLLGQGDMERLRTFGEGLVHTWGTPDGHPWLELAAPSRANDAAFRRWIQEDQAQSGSGAEAAALWQLVIDTRIDGILSSIHVPTLVLWRKGSPHAGPAVAAGIPGATVVELPGEDHVMISGDTRPWLAAVETFIDDVRGRDVDADRVLATVLFTDVVGSTDRAARLGDSAWRELIDRHHAAIRRQLSRFRGREVDTAGDGFFATFDGTARAIRAAAAMRDAVGELGLTLRLGLHAGECERAGAGLRGVAVHVGARIGAAAEPGEILVSSTVRDLVAGSGIGFTDAGRRALKGVPDEWQLYRVTSV